MRPEHTPSPTPSWRSAYQTLRPLARGGMGSVDIAVLRKPGFKRLFAIKRLRPELLEDERAKSMLIEEGRIAGLLQHPNIVPVVDVGEDEQGPYLVMDLVPGVPLGDFVRRARATKTKLDVELVLRLVRDAARGLHAAHELKDASGQALLLVHRDISPQNILVGFDGIARVTDFGIAKVLDRERETTHGLLKGKTGYMAPEQLRFETVDRRADLFSLGVVLYECLAADRLYRGKDLPETARMILHAPPPDIGQVRPDVPPEIVELLFELLAKDRDARPATAKEVEIRLDSAIHGLTPEGGAFDVERFMRTELTDKFEETTQWARLLDSPAALPPSSASTTLPDPVDGVVSEIRDTRTSRHRRASWVGVAAIVVTAGVALGVASTLWRAPEGATQPTTPLPTSTPTPTPSTPTPAVPASTVMPSADETTAGDTQAEDSAPLARSLRQRSRRRPDAGVRGPSVVDQPVVVPHERPTVPTQADQPFWDDPPSTTMR